MAIDANLHRIPVEFTSLHMVRCRIFARVNKFFACVQTVAYAMSATHDPACKFHRAVTRLPSTLARYVLAFFISKREALVDLALRLNVLAVCAVFMFVGAILLKAF
jgi:hypothetical protein